tara:strand:+ start:4468 stop:4698 length:231 start_codon:yes stop_codon:yes gene_type:complete
MTGHATSLRPVDVTALREQARDAEVEILFVLGLTNDDIRKHGQEASRKERALDLNAQLHSTSMYDCCKGLMRLSTS